MKLVSFTLKVEITYSDEEIESIEAANDGRVPYEALDAGLHEWLRDEGTGGTHCLEVEVSSWPEE